MLRIGQRYRGRFHEQARGLVQSGVRVGMMWVETLQPREVHCHVCDKGFSSPTLSPEHKDAFGECPHCHTPFVFAKA